MIQNLTLENFNTAIAEDTPILVDFWATWCGPCMMQGEVLHEIAEHHPDLRIGKVNVDDNPQLAANFGIEVIPTMMLFRSSGCLERVTGLQQEAQVLDLFRRYGGKL